MKMGRKRGFLVCCPSSSFTRENESQVLIGKRNNSTLASTIHLRLRHLILIVIFLLSVSHHTPIANSQPLLNQLAVLLRARPPWPTSFPATASSPSQQQQSSNIQQQQQQSQQHISLQTNNVYPTSSEQLQTFIASNNLLNPQGPLSQGIPVVAMHPSENSITIMTPTGPEQILPPSPSGMAGVGGIFVAQPIQQNDNIPIHHNNTTTVIAAGGSSNDQNAHSNGNNNNSPSGPIVHVVPNPVSFDSQNLIDGNLFASGGIPHLPPSGSAGNFAVPGIPANFPNEQHQFPTLQQQQHQQQQFPAGIIMHSITGQTAITNQGSSNQPTIHSQQPMVVAAASGGGPPPRPPPIPKNFKGPAIIAVPKVISPPASQNQVLIPPPTYLGPMETNLRPLSNNPVNNGLSGTTGAGPQPIIIHSFHQLPNLTPAFPQLLPQPPPQQHSTFPQEQLISLPENAIVNMELNKTNGVHIESPQPPPQQQHVSQTSLSQFQPSQPEHHVQEPQQQLQNYQQPEKVQQPLQSEKESPPKPSHTELSSEIIGNPRNQRKRHQRQRQPTSIIRQQQFHKQLQHYEQHTTRGIFRKKPTARPTQIPLPSESEPDNNQNAFVNRSVSPADYSLSTMINSPSTTITGSFEYPDPPTPPNFQSMNTLKYPSPFEDSAEVAVKSAESQSFSSSSSSSRERKRLRDELQQQLKSSLHLNKAFNEAKRLRSTPISTSSATTTGTFSPTAAETSNLFRTITTASALPETSVLYEGDSTIRDTTTFPASTVITSATTKKSKRDKHRRKGKSSKSRKIFRPSPQIHSFEEPVTGIKSYITILPPVTTVSGSDESKSEEARTTRSRGKKSLFAKFDASESKNPPFQVGFKPVSHYTTFALGAGTTIPAAGTTTETLYFDLIRDTVSKAPGKTWSEPDLNAVTSPGRITVTSATPFSSSGIPNYSYTTLSSTSTTDSFVKAGWKVKDHLVNGNDDRRQLTTSASSEKVEDWRFPDTTDGSKESSMIYFGNGKFGPPNCDKFHRFGFCPMNSGYPTDQVEKIASRCSALLSHLIAPLPKADVRYDVIVSRNGSILKGKSAAPSGWSWKKFSGKPICDTKEIKVVPGWAKNEQGEWNVILQTRSWKQEAQITLCTPQGTHHNNGVKCVQRFTAQRLTVLDPENTDRCPVIRTIFMPSACVALHDSSFSKPNGSKTSKSSGKGKKGSKGGKSKKTSTSKRKSSGRNTRKSNGNISSSEEKENKSDILDTAADSTTSGVKASRAKERTTTLETFQEREQHHQEDSPEDVDENDDERPHAERLKSSPSSIIAVTTTSTDEVESEDRQDNNQNEVDDDDAVNVVDSSNEHIDRSAKTSKSDNIKHSSRPVDREDNDERVTSTVTNSHGGSGTMSEEASASEEENFEEKKMQDD